MIKDINTGEIIVDIDYDHWSVFKKNIYDLNETKTSLHVVDKYGNTAFCVSFQAPNKIFIQGYDIMDNRIEVLSDTGGLKFFDMEQKQAALKEIANIKCTDK